MALRPWPELWRLFAMRAHTKHLYMARRGWARMEQWLTYSHRKEPRLRKVKANWADSSTRRKRRRRPVPWRKTHAITSLQETRMALQKPGTGREVRSKVAGEVGKSRVKMEGARGQEKEQTTLTNSSAQQENAYSATCRVLTAMNWAGRYCISAWATESLLGSSWEAADVRDPNHTTTSMNYPRQGPEKGASFMPVKRPLLEPAVVETVKRSSCTGPIYCRPRDSA